MNVIFIQPNFPGQFRMLAEIFGKNKNNNVVFITSQQQLNKDLEIAGVKKIIFPDKPPAEAKTEKAKGSEIKLPPALSVVSVLAEMKKEGFEPDIIIGNSGPGTSIYVKDVFPDVPFLGFFEWFHNPYTIPEGQEGKGPDLRTRMNLRNKNLSILSDLSSCAHGITSTNWQKSQFPSEYQSKLSVIHSGIDTKNLEPAGDTPVFKTKDIDLSESKEIISYTANLLAPYPGFQQFMEALPKVLEQRTNAHVIIAGADRVAFGDKRGSKKSFKSVILEKVELDMERVHFSDGLSFDEYKALLQASSAHIYVDSPMVISRSLLEAMACGCLVIAPDLPPVKEVIKDGTNGFIADFTSPDKISEKIINCLDFPSFMKTVKEKARQTIVDTYGFEKTLPQQLKIIKTLADLKKKKGGNGKKSEENFG